MKLVARRDYNDCGGLDRPATVMARLVGYNFSGATMGREMAAMGAAWLEGD